MTNTQAPTAPATTTVPCRCTGRLSEICAYHRWLAQPGSFAEYVQHYNAKDRDESWIAELLAKTTPTR